MLKPAPVLISLGALTLISCNPQEKAPDAGSSTSATPGDTRRSNDPKAEEKAAHVSAKVRKIVADHLQQPIDRVLITNTWQQLGADSLDVVELVMAFEEEFQVAIPDERVEKMRTVGDAVTFLSQQAKP